MGAWCSHPAECGPGILPPPPELQAEAGVGAIKHNNVHSVEMLTAGKGRGQLFKPACSSVDWPGPSMWCLPLTECRQLREVGGSAPLGVGFQTQLCVNSPVSCSPKFLFSVKVKN